MSIGLAGWLLCGVCTGLLVPGAVSAQGDDCSNAELRTGASANLPDCRAYEHVSPPDKSGQDIVFNTANTQASSVGGGVAYVSRGAFAETASAPPIVQYIGRRTADGWSTEAALPVSDAASIELAAIGRYPHYSAFSPDLSRGFLTTADPAPLAGAPGGVYNMYARDMVGGGYQLLSKAAPTDSPLLLAYFWPFLADYSADGRRVIFETPLHLPVDSGPEAPAGSATNLYEWADGELRIVGVLPDDEGGGAAPAGAAAGAGAGGLSNGDNQTYTRDTMSEDGRRVYFTTPPANQGPGQIYLRENGTTTHVSTPASGVSDPAGSQPATWAAGTSSGRYAFFTSSEKLTADSTAVALDPDSGLLGSPDLYRYDADTGELIDLSVDEEPADGGTADVVGVLGASAEGKRVYFVARGQIVPGGPVSGLNHLYLWDEDEGVRHIAAIGNGTGPAGVGGVADNWRLSTIPRQRASRVTSDGRFATFLSAEPLEACGDGPSPVACQNDGLMALYRYDAQADRIVCVSCRPDGAPSKAHVLDFVGRVGTQLRVQYLNRYLSDDGSRVFFTTADDLLPARDVNGKLDVYLWEDGAVELISSGKSVADSYFADASPDGRDVYFSTREQLRGSDRDGLLDLYNARAGGGFPDPPPPSECSGDSCQGELDPPPAGRGPVTGAGGRGNVEAGSRVRATVSLRATSQRSRRRLARRGRAAVIVRAGSPGVVTVTASARLGGSRATVATRRVRVRRPGATRVELQLSRRARAALRRDGALRLRIAARLSGAAGSARKQLSLSLRTSISTRKAR